MKTSPSMAPRATSPRGRDVRLTRRGRLCLTVLTLFLTAGVVTATGQGAVATSDRGGTATGVHVVRPGETLWSISHVVAPGSDPRETVSRIMDLNGMGSASVTAGRALVVPG
jgi:hypothetical protein